MKAFFGKLILEPIWKCKESTLSKIIEKEKQKERPLVVDCQSRHCAIGIRMDSRPMEGLENTLTCDSVLDRQARNDPTR